MDSVYRGLVDRYELAGEEGTVSQSRLKRGVVRWFCSSRLMVDPAEGVAVSRDDLVILRVSFARSKKVVACDDPKCGCGIVWCMINAIVRCRRVEVDRC